ncbi:hypothetical protein C8R47DRAFT_189813 [Mycena vitilis]|nr:hypothetical protein C8R47DRAFT_189813 [Mycena vitilis]
MSTRSNGNNFATSDRDSTPTRTPRSLLSQHSETSHDESAAMDWTAEDPSPAVAPSSTLKRPISPDGPASSKRARHSQYVLDRSRQTPGRNFNDRGRSPLDTFLEQGLPVPDLETSLDSILNHLADETQQREFQLERYASDLFHVAPDSSSGAAPLSGPGTPMDFGLHSRDDGSEDELSQNLFDNHFQSDSGNNGGFSTALAAQSVLGSERSEQKRVQNKGIARRFALSAVEDDEMETDSGGPAGEQELNIESSSSHCPCNQCSPTTSAYSDYHPSHDSQAEIHRLFSESPFAPPLN